MHIQEASGESSDGSTPTSASSSSSSCLEPGVLYVRKLPSGKPAFVRRSRKIKTPGALLSDALFNPRSVTQKQVTYQVPDHSQVEPPGPPEPEPQQIFVPPYQQPQQQYPHPQQYPLQCPLDSLPNDMNLYLRPCEVEASLPGGKKVEGTIMVFACHPPWACGLQFQPMFCCPDGFSGRRRRRNRNQRGRCLDCSEHKRCNDFTSGESCSDSSSESDLPVKPKTPKHKNKGRGRLKSAMKEDVKAIYDSSDEEEDKRPVRKPVRPVRPDTNFVDAGVYDSRNGTIRFADGAYKTVPGQLTPDAVGNAHLNHPGDPLRQNTASGPLCHHQDIQPRQSQHNQYVAQSHQY
ncbi:hypothetical protein ACJ72_03970 [Emergomyces africanus]|uniref:Uncharacterized protein n=1 Tax=Emergomyces africanus TaxID=1955775 RepID=A0A1B7NY32_9EURO|nr:hypothetical protein ACJ72_03970 [Emergomyces africanus]